MNEIDHSPYAVAQRLDDLVSVVRNMTAVLDANLDALEQMAKVQDSLVARIKILESQRPTIVAKKNVLLSSKGAGKDE